MIPTVLIFNVTDNTKLRKMQTALVQLGTRGKIVPPEDYGYTLGEIAEVVEKGEAKPASEPFTDEMLIFAEVPDRTLDSILQTFHKKKLGKFPYKAVLTPTNKSWTPQECFTEISAEHEAMTNQGQSVHES